MRQEKKKRKIQTLAKVEETPSHALDAVQSQQVVHRKSLAQGVSSKWAAQEDWPGPRVQASTEGQGITDAPLRLM